MGNAYIYYFKIEKIARFISDFRELNKTMKRKPFTIPKRDNLPLKLRGFKYAPSLDLNIYQVMPSLKKTM